MDSSGGDGIPASTFWCYECDMSVMLLPSAAPLACPTCRGGFLEEMESRRQPPQLGSPPGNDDLQLPLLYHASEDAAGDNIGESVYLDGDYISPPIGFEPRGDEDDFDIFDRLISRIVASSSEDFDYLGGGRSGNNGPRPASKSFVEAIPAIPITEGFLAADRFVLCAVCKEEFVLHTEAKQLPCNHVYHTDCILPWLSKHNSCPVCRFSLPTEDQETNLPVATNPRGELETERQARMVHNLLRSFFPGNEDAMAEAENDLLDIGNMLRRVRRRRLSVLRRSRFSAVSASSSARLSRAELGSEIIANPRVRSRGELLQENESDAGGSGTVDADLGLDHFRF